MGERYISYFQSVITLGITSEGETEQEAMDNAKAKLTNKDGVNHCFFDQTPFEIVATEDWEPEIEASKEATGLKFNFDPSEETKNVIATRLQKDVQDLTDEDYEEFVKGSLQKALELVQNNS